MTSRGHRRAGLDLVASFVVAVAALAAVQCGRQQEVPEETADLATEFADPGMEVRPRLRWWWPGANVDHAELVREVHEIADAGFGGVEIADVYDSVHEPMDPKVYGWGTERWNEAVAVVLEAAKERGLVVDVTIGPHWPSTVPTIVPDDAAAAQEITFGQAIVKGGETYSGELPEPLLPPSGISRGNPDPPLTTHVLRVLAVACRGSCATEGTVTLDAASATDLTDRVVEGRIDWTAPSGADWVLLPIYHRPTGQIVNMFDRNPLNSPVTSPQSYVVDHFGRAGAQAVIDYWESVLLTPRVRALLAEVGGSIFEDSIEIKNTQYWTPGLLEEFEARRGYSIEPYLPVIMNRTIETFGRAAEPAFTFGADNLDERVRHDWEQTLNELWFENRLEPLRSWAESLGMRYRNQGYGTTVDVILSAALTGQPEGESLGFRSNVDQYRALASGRDMGGGLKLSDEMGAFFGAYDTLWTTEMIPTLNRNFAAGVNELYLHGYAYADAPGAQWPGFAAFETAFAEPWNGQQPTWTHIQDLTGYMARTQLVLRRGLNTVDVAYLRPELDRRGGHAEDPSLLRAGYSVGYLSPAVLELPSATVADGRLAPDGPAYRALLIVDEPAMEPTTAKRLLALARAGLPIFFAGATPRTVPGLKDHESQSEALAKVVAELLAEPSVRQVAGEDELLDVLASVGIEPDVRHGEPADVVNVHRRDGGTDFYYLSNNGAEAVTLGVELAGLGTPFALDAWTGAIRPIAPSTPGARGVRIDVSLVPGQATIVAVGDGRVLGGAPGERASGTTADELAYEEGLLVVRDGEAGTYTTTLASGEHVASDIQRVPEPIKLERWTLSVEAWGPGERATQTSKRRLPEITLERLRPWTEIEGLEHVSGVGTYSTTVDLEEGWTGGYGAYLDLGDHVDTVRVRVNGQSVGPVDQIHSVVDVGPSLEGGANTVEVEVATSLANQLLQVRPELAAAPPRPPGPGGGPGGPPRPRMTPQAQGYGLLGPVVLRPYGQVAVSDR